jgi:hypothetical protein
MELWEAPLLSVLDIVLLLKMSFIKREGWVLLQRK